MRTATLLSLAGALLLSTQLCTSSPAEAGTKANAAKEEKKMEVGAPAELRQLAFLEGDWNVLESRAPKEGNGPWTETRAETSYRFILDGAVLEESYRGEWNGQAVTAISWLTFNRYGGVFEETSVNSMSASVFKVGDGVFENGKLVLLGEKKHDDKVIKLRRTWSKVNNDRVEITTEVNKDGSWTTKSKETYSRR